MKDALDRNYLVVIKGYELKTNNFEYKIYFNWCFSLLYTIIFNTDSEYMCGLHVVYVLIFSIEYELKSLVQKIIYFEGEKRNSLQECTCTVK